MVHPRIPLQPALRTSHYQAFDYCITHKITLFEGDVQGEHKLAGCFMPETTGSGHCLADPHFVSAVDTYLKREADSMDVYVDNSTNATHIRRWRSECAQWCVMHRQHRSIR